MSHCVTKSRPQCSRALKQSLGTIDEGVFMKNCFSKFVNKSFSENSKLKSKVAGYFRNGSVAEQLIPAKQFVTCVF